MNGQIQILVPGKFTWYHWDLKRMVDCVTVHTLDKAAKRSFEIKELINGFYLNAPGSYSDATP